MCGRCRYEGREVVGRRNGFVILWVFNRCPAPPPPLSPLQVPRSCQCMLMSATVSDEVEKLNKLILHSPAVLNLLDAGKADGLAAGSGERARGGKGGESGEGA